MSKLVFINSILVFMLFSCSGENPSAPSCRVDSRYQENISGSGRCIIRVNNQLVTITVKGGPAYSLPFSAESVNNSAQCNAHTNMWLSTGFNPEVGKYLGQDNQENRLYSCRLQAGFNGEITHFEPPEWGDSNIKSIQLVDPFDITSKEWGNEQELLKIRRFFNQTH